MLFYLSRHFYEDHDVVEFLKKVLLDQDALFHHVFALIFSFFPDIGYEEVLYRKYFKESHRHWLVQFYMINWLCRNGKHEIISIISTENYFVRRECNQVLFKNSKDRDFIKHFCENMICHKDPMTALQGVYLYPMILNELSVELSEVNTYVRGIISSDNKENFIVYILKHDYQVHKPESFFNENIWDDSQIYSEINMSFRMFHTSCKADASKALLNLNGFNNILFDKICDLLSASRPSEKYGVNLDSGCLSKFLPVTNQYFKDINSARNQSTDAHPYDNLGHLRIRINIKDLEKLVKKQMLAIREICDYNFFDLTK